jgi:hypothetical protein
MTDLREPHVDWADHTPDECEYVCANPLCEHYCIRESEYPKTMYVKCRTELGQTSPTDDGDLDCECGERLIPVDLLGCEGVSEDTVRRYQAAGI